jgi:hypothetical protein
MNFLMAAIGHHTPVITRVALQWTLVIIYNLLHFASTCRLGNRNSYGHLLRIHYNTSSLILTNNINDYNYQQNIQTYTDINNIRATFTHRDPPRVVGSIPTVARHIFQACPVWIYTQRQSNITSILFTWVHYTNTANINNSKLVNNKVYISFVSVFFVRPRFITSL